MTGLSGTTNRRGASGLALVFALALVLLFAQFLGQTHSSVHGSVRVAAHVHAGGHSTGPWHPHQQANDSEHGASGGIMAHLFSGHEDGSADCHTFDQLSHIDAMPGVAALVLPLVIQPFLFSLSLGLATARWHALFQARGPPSLR